MTQYQYDALGRVTRTTYPDGEQVGYSYDAAGNVPAVAGYAAFSGYNALGQPGQIAYQNGVHTGREYNANNNRLTHIATTSSGNETLLDLGYACDANGNITTITDNVQPDNTRAFTYDGLNRLTSAASNSCPATITMSYDPMGNIMMNFDAGNAANRTGQARAYDEDNRLVGADGGSTSTFVYDYRGARVKKISGATETIYVGSHFQLTDGVATKHIFAGGMRIATKDASSTHYYHPDHLGSLRVATNGTGTRVQTVNYYPFGEIRTNTGTVDLPYKFTGREYDPETRLYYYGARYYACRIQPCSRQLIHKLSIDMLIAEITRSVSQTPPASVSGGDFCDFFESFGMAFVCAFTYTIGACFGGPFIAPMLSGAVSGAFSGNITNILKGAGMGGISGLIGPAGMAVAFRNPNYLMGLDPTE